MRNTGWIFAACLTALVGCNRPNPAGPPADLTQVKSLRATFKAAMDSASTGAAEAGPVEATGWATLRGSFKVAGDVSPPEKITADKDVEVCAKEQLFDEKVVVGPGGGLLGAVIFVRTEKLPVHESYKASDSAEIVLDNKNCRFEPHVQVVRVGQTLVLKNSDPMLHNSKIDSTQNPAQNVSLGGNGKETLKYAKAEKQPVKVGCSVHPWMGAYLIVRADPYVAAADKSGGFKIEKVPAGVDLEFQLWHEKTPNGLKGVEIAGVKVDDKGRFKLKLEPDQDKELEIKVPSASFLK